METFLNRYRNITVLLLVIFAQLVLIAVQVKNDQDVRMIRVWTVTAVTPVARVLGVVRGGSIGFCAITSCCTTREREPAAAGRSGPAEDGKQLPEKRADPPPIAPRRCRFPGAHALEECWPRA